MKAVAILVPTGLGLLTIVGLVLALVSDERLDWIAGACLAPTVLVAIRTIALSFSQRSSGE